MRLNFIIKDLDKPNRNGHIFTKECIDNLFKNDRFKDIQETNSLFLVDSDNLTHEDSFFDTKEVIGSVKLENEYPNLKGVIEFFDNPKSEIAQQHTDELYPCMVGVVPLIAEDGVIEELNLECFGYFPTTAHTIEITKEKD